MTPDEVASHVGASETERATITRFEAIVRAGGSICLCVWKDGVEHHFEADWLARLFQNGYCHSRAEPNDCDWPTCGCDPYAFRVIEALEDRGLISPSDEDSAAASGHAGNVVAERWGS